MEELKAEERRRWLFQRLVKVTRISCIFTLYKLHWITMPL